MLPDHSVYFLFKKISPKRILAPSNKHHASNLIPLKILNKIKLKKKEKKSLVHFPAKITRISVYVTHKKVTQNHFHESTLK